MLLICAVIDYYKHKCKECLSGIYKCLTCKDKK